jgi:hypothetical protein
MRWAHISANPDFEPMDAENPETKLPSHALNA